MTKHDSHIGAVEQPSTLLTLKIVEQKHGVDMGFVALPALPGLETEDEEDGNGDF